MDTVAAAGKKANETIQRAFQEPLLPHTFELYRKESRAGLIDQLKEEFLEVVQELDHEDSEEVNSVQRKIKRELTRSPSSPITLPIWITPDFLFNIAHTFAVFVGVYGCLWTSVALYIDKVPGGLIWAPLLLLKLGYPMVPVIIGCWMSRYVHNFGRRLSPGYYFANLKMALLPSLGPGLLLGAVGKMLVLKLAGLERVLGDTYSELLLPFAWLLGYALWEVVALQVWSGKPLPVLGRPLLEEPVLEELNREDWGFYERWIVVPKPSKPWKEWVQRGPHWMFFVIPAPRHGTFHKITQASKVRFIGVTVCCTIAWVILIFVGLMFVAPLPSDHGKFAMVMHTDFANLFTNTLTAPCLILVTWRTEPAKRLIQHGGYLRKVRGITGPDADEVKYDSKEHPFLIADANKNAELELVLGDVVDAVINLGRLEEERRSQTV